MMDTVIRIQGRVHIHLHTHRVRRIQAKSRITIQTQKRVNHIVLDTVRERQTSDMRMIQERIICVMSVAV